MQIATGKDEPSMMITTDKFNAIRDAVGAPVGADPQAVMVAAMNLRIEVNILSKTIGNIKQGVKRQALGILGVVGLTFDDLHEWIVKQEEKGKV